MGDFKGAFAASFDDLATKLGHPVDIQQNRISHGVIDLDGIARNHAEKVLDHEFASGSVQIPVLRITLGVEDSDLGYLSPWSDSM